jgi:seryl-tRNA synthetase
MSEESRALLDAFCGAIDDVIAESDERYAQVQQKDQYIAALETDNAALTARADASDEQGKQFAQDIAALTAEVKTTQKALRKAEGAAEAVRTKEVKPLSDMVAKLKAEIKTMKAATDAAETNAIAYRIPGNGCPDIVVRWTGNDKWSVTDGTRRYWSTDRGWCADHGTHDRAHPESTRFSRADALGHAQALMDELKKRNP